MANSFSKFDILDYPIDSGKVLIEAAAGSGKTYTIQYLFLRLILERSELEAGNILVVTFTEAATEELKERIRTTLRSAAKLLAKISKSRPLDQEKDGDLGRVLAQALKKGRSPAFLSERLQQVRAAFDEVVIATIHGFCNRILSDYAFECGSRINIELVKESRYFLQSVAEDYWRRTFYRGSEALVQTALAEGLTLEKLIELGEQLDRDPDLIILPEQPEHGSWAADIAHAKSGIEAAALSFQRNRGRALSYVKKEVVEIEQLLFTGSPLKAGSWKQAKFDSYFSELAIILNSTSWPDKVGAKALQKFSQSELVNKTKNNHPTPEHPLFHLCEELSASVSHRNVLAMSMLLALKRDFLDFVLSPVGLKLYKEKSRKQGYSDYLTGLDRVLKGPAGARLQRLVSERFKVALVDEFQDTDPVQNSIFNTLFDRPGMLFYRIGDPKQSIYGFRGADIFAYLEAAREPGQQLATLDHNYRSTPELLKVFNRIFSVPEPFLLEEIEFRKMVCGRPIEEQKQLLIDGKAGAALYFWHISGDGGNLNKSSAQLSLSGAVADTCAELLDLARQPLVSKVESHPHHRAEIVNVVADPDSGSESYRSLKASDIAVLTTTNREAAQVWRACQSRNVPAVVAAAENIWETPEAITVFQFLQAHLAPENDYLLSTVLAGSLLGFMASFLAAVHDDGILESKERKEYELWRHAFLRGRELWTEHGIMALFAGFPDFSGSVTNPAPEFDLRLNLVQTVRGERALTNFYHLQEILHQAECEHLFGPEVLLDWFYEHLIGAVKDEDEYELRLESEADTVKIMTVHKSKGLEFPVVFAPFLWSRSFTSSPGRSGAPIFHKLSPPVDGAAGKVGFRRYLDLDPATEKEHQQLKQNEDLAESLRLCYVALTRAQMRLYLAWPQTRDSGKTALMYLRRPPRNESEKQDFLAHGGPAPGLEVLDDSGAERWEELPEIIREVPSLKRTELSADIPGTTVLKAREFARKLPIGSGWLSFSSLTAGTHKVAMPGMKGEGKEAAAVRTLPEEPIFAAFPGGTAMGNAIHKIFEELDFSRAAQEDWESDSQVAELVHNTLTYFSLIESGTETKDKTAAKLIAAVLRMLDKVLNVPLPGGGTTFKLSRSDISLRREMEFCLPVTGAMTAAGITAMLRPEKSPAYNQLDTEQLSRWRLHFPEYLPGTGYLNGFIDLIFCVDERYYLLDWKTNNLGPDYTDYGLKALQQNMLNSDYLLQYNLYLVALNRFLENRLKDYDYETHFGGVYYLYVRGINGLDDSNGIFCDRPEYATVVNLTKEICGT